MNEEMKQEVELEARRVFSSEAAAYREHLETQFEQLKWALGIIVAFAAAAFIYAFGKTYSEFGRTYSEVTTEAHIIKRENLQKYQTKPARLSWKCSMVRGSKISLAAFRPDLMFGQLENFRGQ